MLPPPSVWKGLLLCAATALFSVEADAQILEPGGPESSVLDPRNGEQVWSSISTGPDGGLLVWEDNALDDGNVRGIAAVRLNSQIKPAGVPVRVSSSAAGTQERPQTVLLSGGGALVVWESRATGKAGILGRILSVDGSLMTDEFQISPGTTEDVQKVQVSWSGVFRNRAKTRKFKYRETIVTVREHAGGAALAALPDGGAIVAYHGVRRCYTNTSTLVRETRWNGLKATTNDLLRPVRLTGDWMQDIFVQRVDAGGLKVGSEVRVNQYAQYNQRTPTIALLANGNLIVVWVSERPRTSRSTDNFAVSLYAREMTPSGEPVGDEFEIGEDGTRASANPCVVAMGDGFGVYWSQHQELFSRNWDVYGRLFEGHRPIGPVFGVNVHSDLNQFAPRVASVGTAAMIVWTSVGQDGSREGVYGRALVGGMPAGEEMQINSTTPSRQFQPAVSGAGDGKCAVVWAGYTEDSGFDLFSRIFVRSDGAQ